MSDANATSWREVQLGLVTRYRQRISDTEQKLAELDVELAELDSGRGQKNLERNLEMAIERRGKLQDQFIELGNRRPAGLVARLFRGGISAKQLAAEKNTVLEQISIAERSVVDLQDKVKSYKREAADRILAIGQERSVHTNAMEGVKTTLSNVECELEDFGRVFPILNDIRTLGGTAPRNHSGGTDTARGASKKSRLSKDKYRTTQTSTQRDKGHDSAVRARDAAAKEAHRMAEEALRPYRTPPSSRH